MLANQSVDLSPRAALFAAGTALLTAVVLVAGCTPGPYAQGRRAAEAQRLEEAARLYYQEIAVDPASARAWREIGVVRYQQGNLPAAAEALKQSIAIEPDARTHLYLGLVHEQQEDLALAIHSYRTALGLKPPRQTRRLVESYLDVLVQAQVEREIQRALAEEAQIDPSVIPANSVAVMAFDASQLPPELAPLSLGLSDFTAQDLAKIGSLQVVDRLKIDAVRRELELAGRDLVDPATAPRVGRLIGGRRLVTGSVLALGDDRIRLSGAIVDAVDRTTGQPEQIDGALAEFFRVQKDFVFRVVAALGITLTPAERAAIEEVPTESYLAFMAYCRGLGLRQEGRTSEAAAEFRRAASADRNFGAAAAAGERMAGRLMAGLGAAPDAGLFAAAVGEIADVELLGEPLADAQANLLRIQAFVPAVGEVDLLGQPPSTPPRTGDFGQTVILIRGNLDGGY